MDTSDREQRNLQKKKQEVIKTGSGIPLLSEIKEQIPVIRYIEGKGLYLIAKYNNELWYNKFSKNT